MKAYIVQSEKKIEPFDEHPPACLIRNKTLETLQQEVLLSLGICPVKVSDAGQINDLNEHLVFDDSIFFTKELLEEFITKSRKQQKHTICSLKPDLATLRSVHATQEVKIYTGHIEYNMHYLAGKKSRGEAQPLIIEPGQNFIGIPMPEHICANGQYLIPLTEKIIIQIGHWVNLWSANISTLLADVAKLQKMPKMKLALIALRVSSLNRWKVLSQLNKIGQNCDLHPTCYIEASTIGNNVTIGAGAIIRESVIDDGVFIGNGVVVEESIIGKKSTILNGHIMYSVFYPGTFSGAQWIGVSLIGKDTFIGAGVTFADFRLDGQNVRVMKNGVKIDTGNEFIGCCLGHRVRLGTGCIMAPGRMIPSDIRLTPEKERIIRACILGQDIPGFRLV